MTKSRIGVLMGGTSSERDVSLATGRAVLRGLEEAGRFAVPVLIDDAARAARAIEQSRIDVAFLALHGRLGEDGCIQGLLELFGIPYTGSGVMASALAMDKMKAKELFRLHNVPTPPYYAVDRSSAEDIEDIHGSFGFPVAVKPRREGSSLGVSKAASLPELAVSLERAFSYDDSAIVERFITAREVHVGLLDGRVLGAIEVVPKSGMYDYAAKYTPGSTDYFCPARLPATRYRGVLNLAERAAQALETTSAVRVDLLVTEGQNEYVLEVNTLPGMTPTSLLPKIAASVGFDFPSLCAAIVDRARLHAGMLGITKADDRAAVAEAVQAEPAVRVA